MGSLQPSATDWRSLHYSITITIASREVRISNEKQKRVQRRMPYTPTAISPNSKRAEQPNPESEMHTKPIREILRSPQIWAFSYRYVQAQIQVRRNPPLLLTYFLLLGSICIQDWVKFDFEAAERRRSAFGACGLRGWGLGWTWRSLTEFRSMF